MLARFLPWTFFFFSATYCYKDETCPQKCQNILKVGENQPSIVYKKTRGRLGNQLNGYTMLLQLKKDFGYDAYILQETYDILSKMFTEKSIQEVPVLEQIFCHHSQLKFQVNTYLLLMYLLTYVQGTVCFLLFQSNLNFSFFLVKQGDD